MNELKGEKAVVCGAGGFIGGHLVKSLMENGVDVVRAVDMKPLDEWYQVTDGVENLSLDLKDQENCHDGREGRDDRCISLPPIWAAWASSRTTRRCAC